MNPSEQFQSGIDAQLLEQIGQMMADGDGRDVKEVGNVFVGQALSDQQGDLLFTIGQGRIKAFMQGGTRRVLTDGRFPAIRRGWVIALLPPGGSGKPAEVVDGCEQDLYRLNVQYNAVDAGQQEPARTVSIFHVADGDDPDRRSGHPYPPHQICDVDF